LFAPQPFLEFIMATLPDMLRAEIARCQSLIQDYAALGSAGAFAHALLREALAEAQQLLRCGDVHAIQQSVERLRTFREVMPDVQARRAPAARPMLAAAHQSATLNLPATRAYQHRSVVALWGAPQPQPVQEQFFTWTRRA
jgi:hypothetical protein